MTLHLGSKVIGECTTYHGCVVITGVKCVDGVCVGWRGREERKLGEGRIIRCVLAKVVYTTDVGRNG